MIGGLLAQVVEGSGWRYAAWVALDLRLLLFLILISSLGAVGICIILVRRRRWLDLIAGYLVSFLSLLVLLIIVFNNIAHYPVFVVESFFPFP